MSKNPKSVWTTLFYLWLGVSTFANIVALASLSDGIVAWAGFIQELIASYRTIRDAVWGNFFSFIHVAMPAWVGDYLTINSIFSVSLLWALSAASRSIASDSLGSVIQYIRNNILDLTVGGTLPRSFARQAADTVNANGHQLSDEDARRLSNAGRTIISALTIFKASIMLLLAGVLYLVCSFPLPWVLRFNDWWDTRLTRYEFGRLRERLKAMNFNEDIEPTILKKFDEIVEGQGTFDFMNKIFHKTLLRSLVGYLIIVVVLFALLVFLNQIATSILSVSA